MFDFRLTHRAVPCVIGVSESFIKDHKNRPEGFNSGTDYMARYSVDFSSGERNDNIQIADSDQCRFTLKMRAIAKAMKAFGADYAPKWNRTEDSIVTEWTCHNIYAWASDSAKHTDFDNFEENKGFFYFAWKALTRVFS